MLNNFFKFFTVVFLLAMFLFTQNSFAQLTGTKTIPGDYATLADAITALNTQGVGSGGVTLNLIAGNPETAPAGGYVIGGTGSLVLTTTNATDQVIIQGNGNTITANGGLTVGALNDAIFKLIGADYVTINNFVMLENAANTVTTAASNNMTEFGVALFYVTTTDGANNNKITNCTIDLNRTYQNTFGIYANATHSATAVTTSATATGLLGGNSGLVITGNTITDVNMGIVVVGPTAAADNNDGVTIGGSAPNANTITNYGTTGTFSGYVNVSGTVNGILIRNTKNFSVSYNTITSSVGGVTAGTLNGIQVPAFSNAPTGTFTNSVSNNTISLQSGLIAGAMNGINVGGTSASVTSSININNNNFVNFGHTVAGTGAITFITQAGTHLNQSISNNTFTNINVNTTGSVTFISNSVTLPAGGTQNIDNNSIVTAFNKTGAGGTITLFTTNASSPAGTTVSNSNNNFSNITVTGATTIAGWANTDGGAPTKTIQNNTFSNWTGGTSAITVMNIGYSTYPSTITGNTITNITGQAAITGLVVGSSSAYDVYSNTINNLSSTGTGGSVIGLSVTSGSNNVYSHNIYALSSTGAATVYGISVSGATLNKIYKNNIYNLTNTNAGGTVGGLLVSSGTAVYAYNNFISDLRAPNLNAANSLLGISITGGTTVGLYYNTVFLNATSVGALFGSSALSASSTPTLDLRNNIFVNLSIPVGATGYTSAYRRSSTTLTSYSSLSNNNAFYAGTPGANNLLFYDGTNSDQTIATYKTRVSPRDANSFTENVAFVNITTAPYDLHVNTSAPTQTESGGTPITTPVAITDDFEGNLRSASTPDVGADEFSGTGLDLTAPNFVYTLLGNTSYLSNRQLTVTISDPSGVATSPNGPVLYYKKKNDVSFASDNNPSVAGSNYTFTINYANIGGVTAGDTIQYYVAAMDLAGNSGTSPAGGSGTPPGSTPPATFNSYSLVTALALPYSQDFNAGTTLPTGWGGNMTVIANHGITGSNGLTRNLYSGVTSANSTTPIVGLITATTQLEFDYRIVNYSGYPSTGTAIGASDIYNIRISTDDGATYTTVYTINQANHVVSTNFANVIVPLGAYAGYNGVIKFDLQWGTGDYYFDIDNVLLREPPVGPPSAAVLVSPANNGTDISINTTLNWSSGGGALETGYRIYFGTDGGGVTPPTNIANNVDLGLVTSYTPASPLAYSTTYYWQIVPYNGSGNATGNVIWSFTTGPNPAISTFPYAEGFEGTSFPPYGYTTYGTKLWTSGTEAHSGTKAAKISYTPAGTGNLQTPSVILPASPNYRIKFWWKDDDITLQKGNGIEIAGADTTYFEVSTDGGTNWSVITFLSAASYQSSYSEVIQNLTSYAGQTVTFRWRDVSNGTLSAYGTGLDDITIEQIPSVLDPTPFTATTINSSQINLAFTPDPATHNVVIVWNSTGTFTEPVGAPVVGSPLAGGTVLSVGTTSPVNHTGLTFATTYYYKAFSYDGATYSSPGLTANATTNVVNPTGVTALPFNASQINLGWTKNANNDNVMVVTNLVNTFGVPVNGTTYAANDTITGGGTVIYNGSASTFNHTSLTAGTTYYYKVFSAEAVTNNYSSGVTANATTPFALPYFQNFNAATTIPAGWSTTFSVSATHGASGTNGLYRNLYSSVTTATARTPFMGLAAANTSLEFDYRIVDYTGYPATGTVYAAGNYIQVQVSTDNTTWNTVYTIDNTTHVTSNAFANKQINIGAYSGSYVYVRFNCQWASGDYYIDFDNVYIGPPSVANPGSFSATSISTSQIDLAFTTNPSTNNVVIVWNNTGTFTVPSGTPPAVGQPFAGGTLLSNGIVSPVNHTGLTASTVYYYKAFSYSGTEYSTGLDANASTSCGVATLPFNESFDGTTFPPTCWTRINAGTGNNWLRSTSAPYSGAGHMRYSYNSSFAANTWMITPEFTLTGGKKYYVSFYQNTSGSYPEKLKVTVGNAPDVASQTTVLWNNAGGTELTNATYELRIAEFVAPTTGSYYFGFNCYSDADMWYLDVDQISIIEQPTVDLAFTNFYQSSGLPVPRSGQNFSDYNVSMNKQTIVDGSKEFMELSNQPNAVSSSNVNNTVLVTEPSFVYTDALGNINLKAEVTNLGVNAASYNLNWNVNGVSQAPYSGPTVNSGNVHLADLTYVSTERGTFITAGAITVTGDEIASNNANQFRMRVYPDSYTRTIYDRGDNLVDTYVGWGATATTYFKAGVRFTTASEIKLAGVDFIYRTEDLTPGEITVQVRAAGTTTTAPGALLYTAVFNTAAYFSSTGDYIHLPFGEDSPIIASGSDYWITVKIPLGPDYPGGAQTGTGITLGRSFYESSTDTTLWNAFILSTVEYAWIMRSVEVSPGPATFSFSTSVNNGWNMVSAPGLHPVDQNVTTWWSGKDPAAGVFRYNNGYIAVTTTTPGQGYWMKHAGAHAYNYSGIQVVPNNPITANVGWNLIGGYELNVLTSAITTTPGGLQTGSVYQYSSGYTVATNLIPGYGYWIKLSGAGSINIPTSLAKGTAKVIEVNKDWGRIIITDASGKSYTLYTVKGEVNLDDYELPPAPPAGMFDVRFGSNRYAEALGSSVQTVELNSLEYPITVKVENADIRLQDQAGNGLNERLRSGEQVLINNSSVSKLMVSGDVIPTNYSLEQNYPNPFNPSTKIEFSLPEDVNNVTLTIYDALGQKVAELVNGKLEAGKYNYVWNANSSATGLYIYELRTDKFVSVKKMLLLK
jgi:hypothetical protein